MYLLFRFHDLMPDDYKKKGKGAKEIIRAFMYRELEDMEKERG